MYVKISLQVIVKSVYFQLVFCFMMVIVVRYGMYISENVMNVQVVVGLNVLFVVIVCEIVCLLFLMLQSILSVLIMIFLVMKLKNSVIVVFQFQFIGVKSGCRVCLSEVIQDFVSSFLFLRVFELRYLLGLVIESSQIMMMFVKIMVLVFLRNFFVFVQVVLKMVFQLGLLYGGSFIMKQEGLFLNMSFLKSQVMMRVNVMLRRYMLVIIVFFFLVKNVLVKMVYIGSFVG